MTRADRIDLARGQRDELFDRERLLAGVRQEVLGWSLGRKAQTNVWSAAAPFLLSARAAPGMSVQDWWQDLETRQWAISSKAPGRGVTWNAAAVRALIVGRFVTASWPLLSTVQVEPWLAPLPADDPWAIARGQLRDTLAGVGWATPKGRRRGVCTGMRLMIARGYDTLEQLTDTDLEALPPGPNGTDMLDVALCTLGVFDRSPRRGTVRRKTEPAKTVEQLVGARVPHPFQEVTAAYLHCYQQRVSANYSTTRTKIRSLAYFWTYLADTHPEVVHCRDILPAHARGFPAWALVTARSVQRNTARKGAEDRTTTYDWMVDARAFFTDLCTWGTEPGSPLAEHTPRTVPLTTHDLNSVGFAAARARTAARMTATVMDVSREVPNIRAFALRRWHETSQHLELEPEDGSAVRSERDAFWDWALLELLLTSGLRVEEASELTTLDVLKRVMPDGRAYYLLHIKPSKYDRARVIPMGDGLGRVIAEIIRHVKAFYASTAVPACDRRDSSQKTPLPRAPYLLQGAGHPSAMSIATIRERLQHLSVAAGARHADGTPLRLAPHDCRRMFATEALNANTPVHVIAALLGHESLDTVMIYDDAALQTPSPAEWAAFAAGCNLRDMGTHVCALPTGEHCSRGLVCLGCNHAQPKKSAAPVFRRMITSHTRALAKAQQAGEPAGQIAAREAEVQRIQSALTRAEALHADVADALEAEAV